MSGSPQRKRSRLEHGTCCWSRERALYEACLPCVREHFAELSSHVTLSEAMELLHSERSSIGHECTACLSHLLKTFPQEQFRSLQEDGGLRAALRARCGRCMAAFVEALGSLLLDPLNMYALLQVAAQEDEKKRDLPCQHMKLLVTVLANVVEPARVQAMAIYVQTEHGSSSGLMQFLDFLSQHGSVPQQYEHEYQPLQHACTYGSTIEICSALLKAGLDPFELRDDGSSLLHAAASLYTDPKRATRSQTASALLQAAAQRTGGSSTVQQLLLALNSKQQTAVHLAVGQCDAELLTVLLDAAAAAAVTAVEPAAATASAAAAAAAEPVAAVTIANSVTAALLAAKDSEGLTPVLQAVVQCSNDTVGTEVFKVLVAAAVRANCLSEVLQAAYTTGATVMQLLQRKGYTQWLSMLSDNGVQVSYDVASARTSCCIAKR
jgi:ankyrin repeat protein